MNYYMKSSNTNTIEYYVLYISYLVISYFSIILFTYFLKSNFETNHTNEKKNNPKSDGEVLTVKQKQLRWKFLVVSVFIKAATWIKAPYLFALYNRVHGFSLNDIGVLYAIDNISALLSGPFFGCLSDMYGRKKFCLLFCLLVILHIGLRVTGVHDLAYLAQVLSGFSGSLIETVFESWVNYEANSLFEVYTAEGIKSKNTYLREIFTKQTNVDCFCSIFLTGIATVLYVNLGIFYPFYACIALSVFAFLLIAFLWDENKPEKLGKNETKMNFYDNIAISIKTLRDDKALFSVGIIESLFKVSLNLFLFIWTPLLEETAGGHIHPGAIFVCFMIARLIGSELFESIKILFKTNTYLILMIVTITGCLSFFVDFYVYSFNVRLFMFVYFDGISGVFQPLISSLKSQMIPEKNRTTIMNFFRMPINIFSIITLLFTHVVTSHQICLIAFMFMVIASIFNVFLLFNYTPPDKEKSLEKENSSESLNKICFIASNASRRH